MSKKHLVFCYGTLKSNYGNNRAYLSGQEFVREAETKPLYRLFDNGSFPYMIKDEDNGAACKGEVWRADEDAMQAMDRLEGVPHHYTREILEIDGFDEPVFVYLYRGDPTRYPECTPLWEKPDRRRA